MIIEMTEIIDVSIVDDCIMNEFFAENSIWANVSVIDKLRKFDKLLLIKLNFSTNIEKNTFDEKNENENDCDLKINAENDRMTSKWLSDFKFSKNELFEYTKNQMSFRRLSAFLTVIEKWS